MQQSKIFYTFLVHDLEEKEISHCSSLFTTRSEAANAAREDFEGEITIDVNELIENGSCEVLGLFIKIIDFNYLGE